MERVVRMANYATHVEVHDISDSLEGCPTVDFLHGWQVSLANVDGRPGDC